MVFAVVTFYATLGEEAVAFGLNECGATHLVTSAELLETKLKVSLLFKGQKRHVAYNPVYYHHYRIITVWIYLNWMVWNNWVQWIDAKTKHVFNCIVFASSTQKQCSTNYKQTNDSCEPVLLNSCKNVLMNSSAWISDELLTEWTHWICQNSYQINTWLAYWITSL